MVEKTSYFPLVPKCQVATMSQQKSQNSVNSEKRVSQWENLMRKFSEAHKEQCKISVDIPRVVRSIKQFPTGSQYHGTWDVLGMSGVGTYEFPNGVIYEGEFNDGVFHGNGDLKYPSGETLRCKWHKGQMLERTLIFADGLKYSETDWKYCQLPDRRFTIEYEKGLQPAGRSFMTAEQPSREIPPGFYDTGDGFYDPKTKVIYKADDSTAIVRSPSMREQQWIIANCRTAPDKEMGPRLDLYEEWSEPQTCPKAPPRPAANSRPKFLDSCISFNYDDDYELIVHNAHDTELINEENYYLQIRTESWRILHQQKMLFDNHTLRAIYQGGQYGVNYMTGHVLLTGAGLIMIVYRNLCELTYPLQPLLTRN